jgi:hypothetical protein
MESLATRDGATGESDRPAYAGQRVGGNIVRRPFIGPVAEHLRKTNETSPEGRDRPEAFRQDSSETTAASNPENERRFRSIRKTLPLRQSLTGRSDPAVRLPVAAVPFTAGELPIGANCARRLGVKT